MLHQKHPNGEIHIFSQSNFDVRFSALRQIENIHIHLDEINASDTFHHLVNADVLVTGTSSFSYLAALYNKNKIYFTQTTFHKKALDSWQTI